MQSWSNACFAASDSVMTGGDVSCTASAPVAARAQRMVFIVERYSMVKWFRLGEATLLCTLSYSNEYGTQGEAQSSHLASFCLLLRIDVVATMRSACLAATLGLAAAATDVSPPTISLNLVDGSPVTAGTTCEVQDATVTTYQ